jgi:phage portal protein BeeE
MFNIFRRPSADPFAMPEAHPPERKAARPLLAAQLPRSSGGPAQDYASLCRDGFARNPIAHRCVRLIAESAASVPLHSPDARISKLMSRGLPGRSAVENRESFYGYLQLGGNGFLGLDARHRGTQPPFSPRHGDGQMRLVSYAPV